MQVSIESLHLLYRSKPLHLRVVGMALPLLLNPFHLNQDPHR